jgi:hypothetical protein
MGHHGTTSLCALRSNDHYQISVMPRHPSTQRCHLTVWQKLALIEQACKTGWTQDKLARWATTTMKLNVPLSRQGVGLILASKSKLLAVPERRRGARRIVADPDFTFLDTRIAERVDDMDDCLETVSDMLIILAAEDIADELKIDPSARPSFSSGWLQKFKLRWGYARRRKHGEAGSVDAQAALDGRAKMINLTRQYEKKDVFNMDETSFFYRSESLWTVSRKSTVSGRKQSKVRMTLALAANADGSEKLPPYFIGTAVVPHALRGRDVSDELGVTYTSTRKGWMTSSRFIEWLQALDIDMRRQGRQILLLVDNASPHVRPTIPMTNVRLEFLPPNTTSVLQPLDQGVIACVKRGFTRVKARRAYVAFKENRRLEQVSVYDAMQWANEAWGSVTAETISNCWQHAGILWDPRKLPGILNPCDETTE